MHIYIYIYMYILYIFIYEYINTYGLVKENTYFCNISVIVFYIHKICLLQLSKSVAKTVKLQK